jgi:(p)ppGpp synthase/HD superfamily hydrolase
VTDGARRLGAGRGLLELADRIAEEAHRGQSDQGGAPYIAHPRRVAQRVADRGGTVEQRAAALLHDVLEDTEVTEDDLRAADVPEAVVSAVVALTRTDETYEAAVRRAAAHPVARLVKRCDLEDNTDPDRLALLDEATRTRLTAKYRRAIGLLDEATGD